MAATFWVALILMTHAAAAMAQSAPEPIRYTLSFPAPQTHYLEVTATVPTGRRADVELMMAVWTPGSYLVREYARNVEAVTALVDSPIVIGNPAVYDFEVDGKKHSLVDVGEGGVFDGARAAKDLEKIVNEDRRLWGLLPYDRYVFFNMITESGGGLEHKNSTVLMTNRWSTRTRRAYLAWLQLASHEYFHAWNVKRLRPAELGPFDYENENTTRSLWIVEGFTDYYADLQVERAGLQTHEEYLEDLSSTIELLQTTPGRLLQSAEMASFDAGIKYYRPDENSNNTSVSYYTKGTVIAFLLDAKIRKATDGAKSLDDVMRSAYQKFSGPKGYTSEEFRAVVEQVAGTSLKGFWQAAVEGTKELDYSEALDTFGLRFKAAAAPSPERTKPWLGLTTRNDNGRLVIASVQRDAPSDISGLNVDDEILAIDDFRVRVDRLENRLEQYKAGDKVTFLVARREHLMRIPVTFATEPSKGWRLDISPSATDTQRRMFDAWLRS